MRLIISPSGQGWQLFLEDHFFNFILAFIFSIIVIGMSGADIPKISKVEKIHQHMKRGIRKGDIMIKVAGKKMHNYRGFPIICI